MADLDAIRARFPHLGVAVYAYTPTGPVTLELHTPDGAIHAVTNATLAECIAAVFPDEAAAPEPPNPDPFG